MEAIGAIQSTEIKATDAVAARSESGTSPHRDRTIPNKVPSSEESKANIAQVEKKEQEKVRRIAQMMDEYVKSNARGLSIQVNQGTGDVIVRVISKEDGRTIREIPAEEILHLAAKMEEMMGLLFNEKV